jgi:hypothetical protein
VSPSFSVRGRATSFSTNSSWIDDGTISRVPDSHTWPWWKNVAHRAPSTAASRLASS